MKDTRICENCGNIKTVKFFSSPYEYLQCVEYIKSLISNGNFELREGNCSLDEVKDKNGCWADDIIYHVIKCKKCGQKFSCCCNTYRGGGGFKKGL